MMRGHILIADNNSTNRIVLRVRLSAASYRVSQAASAEDVMVFAASQKPDLILIEGGFDGDRVLDLLQDLKERPQTRAIPVLILATDFSAAERFAALMAGASDILQKPVKDTDLLAAVRSIQRASGVDDELRLREDTAIELGFQEPAAAFEGPANILMVGVGNFGGDAWEKALKKTTSIAVHNVAAASVFDFLARSPISPDIIVLQSAQSSSENELFLLAELRNREQTRHAEILVLQTATNGQEPPSPSALDLGANEAVPATIPAGELAFRIERLLKRKQKADKLRGTVERGLRMAVTDPLTGLFNRRYALPHMARIAEKSQESGNPFAVMVLDLDHFKSINDTHGHQAGDLVLCEIAKRLKENVRNVDLLARIGGEEFLVVMPDTDPVSARHAAERLRQVTQAHPIHIKDQGDAITVTTSIGVSIAGQQDALLSNMEAVVERADQALMGAKSTGRNQVMFEQTAA